MKNRGSNIFIKSSAHIFFFGKSCLSKEQLCRYYFFFCILNLNECENYLARAGCTPIAKLDYGVSSLGYKNSVLICC